MMRPKDHTTMSTDNTAAGPADPELVPLREFLRRFSVSKSAFYRMAAQGGAPDVVKLGRATFVPLASARAWLQSRVIPAQMLSQSARGAA
jgi:predicted DNA-binding transcriptional regulator AlpA